jgi:hypothetical protein
MDERKRASNKDDDVPIIGDYSEAADARLRAESRPAPPPAPAPEATRAPDERTRTSPRATHDAWRLDPADVRRHARLTGQRKRVGLLGRLSRYGLVAAALVAAFMVYRNFETLRGVTIDFSAVTSLFADRSGTDGGGTSPRGGEAKTEEFEAPRVAGVDAPTSVHVPRPTEASAESPAARAQSPTVEPPAARPESPSAETPPPAVAATPADAVVASAPSAPATPEPPPEPESFEFGVGAINVSEADASAAVLILRNDDHRRPSAVIWWTEDGTAKAGADYVDLGRVVEKFAAGEQNRTIHIPIVGDHQVEGPETFYVYLAPSENADPAAEPAQKVEVVINDAD